MATVGLGEQDLSTNQVWLIYIAMVGFLLLRVAEQLVSSTISPSDVDKSQAATQEESPVTPRSPSVPRSVDLVLIFLALAFVIVAAMLGWIEPDLSSNRFWVTVAGVVGLMLMMAVDRIQTISISPAGFEATITEAKAPMTEVKAQALAEISALVEDSKAAEAAQELILQATDPEQVIAAVTLAVELNVTRAVGVIIEAIKNKHRCYVRYRPVPDEPVQSYYVAPLDIKPGKSAATRANDYLWAYSYEHESVVSLRLDRVIGVEMSEEVFDPAEVTTPGKEPEWNVAREW